MKYPFGQHETAQLKAASGRAFNDLTLDQLDDLTADDISIHADTLRAQAEVARRAGYPQVASNLLRAAELTSVSRDDLLRIYNMLRPDHASFAELMRLAGWLETEHRALENARFVREAAEVYRQRGLLRREA
ncbi:MAG: diol dehydratase small subunit [Anaerolineae bacterium]